MIMAKEKLMVEAKAMGFRPEMFEKALLLADLLQDYANHPFLKNRIALKGGTGLNLFYFGLPRLSVDIDLNYIGAQDKETMLAEREDVDGHITSIAQRKGFFLERLPKRHAGGKLVLRYPSVLGYKGTLEVDMNYMFRVPLLPIQLKESISIGAMKISNIPVLDIHELAAGKLTALFDRTASRDLFDSHFLLTNNIVDIKILRPLFMLYGAISHKSDWQNIKIKNITIESKEIKNRLIPLLKQKDLQAFQQSKKWAVQMVEECQEALKSLLPLTNEEKVFFKQINQGQFAPELIFNNAEMIEHANQHPAIQWKLYNINRNG